MLFCRLLFLFRSYTFIIVQEMIFFKKKSKKIAEKFKSTPKIVASPEVKKEQWLDLSIPTGNNFSFDISEFSKKDEVHEIIIQDPVSSQSKNDSQLLSLNSTDKLSISSNESDKIQNAGASYSEGESKSDYTKVNLSVYHSEELNTSDEEKLVEGNTPCLGNKQVLLEGNPIVDSSNLLDTKIDAVVEEQRNDDHLIPLEARSETVGSLEIASHQQDLLSITLKQDLVTSVIVEENKKFVEKLVQEVIEKIADIVVEEAIEGVVKSEVTNAVDKLFEASAKEYTEEIVKETTENMTEEANDIIAEELSKDVVKEEVDEASAETVAEVVAEDVEEVDKEFIEEIDEEFVEEFIEEVNKDFIVEDIEKIDVISEKAPEQVAEKEKNEDIFKDTIDEANKKNFEGANVVVEKVLKEKISKENVVKENVVKENVVKENVTKEDVIKEDAVHKKFVKENVVKEYIIEENVDKKVINEEPISLVHCDTEKFDLNCTTKKNSDIAVKRKSGHSLIPRKQYTIIEKTPVAIATLKAASETNNIKKRGSSIPTLQQNRLSLINTEKNWSPSSSSDSLPKSPSSIRSSTSTSSSGSSTANRKENRSSLKVQRLSKIPNISQHSKIPVAGLNHNTVPKTISNVCSTSKLPKRNTTFV